MPYFLLQKLMESAAPKMQPATELSQGKQPLGNRMIVMVIRCIRVSAFRSRMHFPLGHLIAPLG